MCDKCKMLGRDIENFRRQQKAVDDRVTLFLIAEAISDLEAKKASLHPVTPQGTKL